MYRGFYTAGAWCALLLGLLLLVRAKNAFEPYAPNFKILGRSVGEDYIGPVVILPDSSRQALYYRDLADEAMARGKPGEAVAYLQQAIRYWSFAPYLYQRLAAAYASLGRDDLAQQAWHAANFTVADAVPVERLENPIDMAIPLVADWTRHVGLDDCIHAVGLDESQNFAAPGIAVYDFDADGWDDVVCLGGTRRHTRLYRGTPRGFVWVENSGFDQIFDTQGVYVADVNNDQRRDVLVTTIGTSQLFINQGALRFKRKPMPRTSDRWSSAVAFGDLNEDGCLDLVLGSYLPRNWLKLRSFLGLDRAPPGGADISAESRFANPVPSRLAPMTKGMPELPDVPLGFPSTSVRFGDALLVLLGDCTGDFTDASARAGIDLRVTNLNLELIDVNHDRHLDLVVINDAMPTSLWLGRGDGTFYDVTHRARFVDLRAGMGLAVADFDRNGEWDFVTTHFQGEMNGLFLQRRFDDNVPVYADVALESGFGVPGIPYVGWSVHAWDYDADGDEDILVWNGHLTRTPQPPHLFRNDRGFFTNLSESLPAEFATPLRARSAALFDWDKDGYDDIVVSQAKGPARFLKLTPRHVNHWVRIHLAIPDILALGSVISIETSEGSQIKPVRTGNAYFGAQPRSFYFGLGGADRVHIAWVSLQGKTVTCRDQSPNQVYRMSLHGCAIEASRQLNR